MNGVQKSFRFGFVTFSALGAIACGDAQPGESPALAQIQSELSALPEETAVTQALAASATVASGEPGAEALVCDAMCNAKSWIGEQRYSEAREALQRHLVQSPRDVNAALLLTSADIAEEEYATAYERANAWLDEEYDVRLSEKRALASLLAQDVETASTDYRELITDLRAEPEGASVCDPLTARCQTPVEREAHAWVGLATAEYNRQNLDDAERIAKSVLNQGRLEGTLDPAYGQFISALVDSQRGQDDQALENYQAILARFPNEPASLNNIGGIHYRKGDLVTARHFHMASYEAADDDSRSAAIAWSNVGEIDMLEGKFEDAEDKMLEATSISKSFAGAHFNLAVLYDVLGKHGVSMRHMRRGLELDEQGVTRWNTSWFSQDWQKHFDALVATAEGRTEDAQALFSELRRSDNSMIQKAAVSHGAKVAPETESTLGSDRADVQHEGCSG